MPRAPRIIDFAGFHTPDPALKATFLTQIRQACQDHGFFQITNHGIPDDIQASILSQARDLFSLPTEVKERYSMVKSGPGNDNRGYERFRSQNFEKRGPGDRKEGFYLGKDLPTTHASVVAGKFSQGANKYPDEVRDPEAFRAVVDEYHERMSVLAGEVMGAVAMTLGMEEGAFEGFCEEPVAILRLLRYPAQERGVEQFERGIGAHTDFGAITILLQDNQGGLQVWDNESSAWADVTPHPGALVVNLGNMMMRWTNDRYLSNLHRVVNYSGEDRYSVPFFFAGNPDYVVECLPGCKEEGQQAKYPPITVAEWMGARYADTYGRTEKGMAELSREAAGAIG